MTHIEVNNVDVRPLGCHSRHASVKRKGVKGDQLRMTEKATSEGYRQVIRDIVKDLNRPNLGIIEGPDLRPDIGGLSQDLIHPGVRGMIQIGEELARRLAEMF